MRVYVSYNMYNISIHALLAESDPRKTDVPGAIEISIHALLAESDFIQIKNTPKTRISIHALLAESDFGGNDYEY